MKFLEKGQTLIEVSIALSALLITLAAITVAVTTSVNNSDFIRSQALASKYAQQGMEYIRFIRNTDITAFNLYASPGSGYNCMNENNIISINANCGGAVNVASTFVREVSFSQGNSQCSSGTLVTVTVKWSSGKCDPSTNASRFCHKAELISCFNEQNSSATL